MFPSTTHKDWNYYSCQTGKCCVVVQQEAIYVTLPHIKSKGISCVGVVHCTLYIHNTLSEEEEEQ